MYRLATFLFLFAKCSLLSAFANTLTEAQLSEQSHLWPARVGVLETVKNEETGKQMKAGKTGILLRVEDSKVIVDGGRFGVHAIPFEKTDILERSEKIANGAEPKGYANLVGMLANKFFDPTDPNTRSYKMEDLVQFSYFLFFYVKADSQASVQAIEQVKAFRDQLGADHRHIEVFMLSLDAVQMRTMELIEEHAIEWPTVLPFLSKSYRKALHHEPDELPCLVLTDQNGKVFYHSLQDFSEGGVPAFLKAVEQHLAAE